jgi:hypothetical protein
MAQEAIAASVPWYRSLNREQWRVLFLSNLGWLFDGFEIYALFLTVGFALHQLHARHFGQRPLVRPWTVLLYPCFCGPSLAVHLRADIVMHQ